MARSHGRLLARIWADPEWRKLSSGAQRVYMLLLSQPNLTHAGTIPLTLRRWASYCGDTTEQELVQDVKELEHSRFIVVDPTTEELLVRTLIRNDGVWKQPKVFMSAATDARAVASWKLRRALISELRTLPIERDDEKYKKGEVAFERDRLLETLTELETDPPETHTDTPTKELAIPDAKSPRSASGGAPTPAPTPLPSHSGPPPPQNATAQQRADQLTRIYHQAINGMCNFPAVLGIVKKAIKADQWADESIEAALQRLADEGRTLTTESLRLELDGFAARAGPNKATVRTAQNLALVQRLQEQERGA